MAPGFGIKRVKDTDIQFGSMSSKLSNFDNYKLLDMTKLFSRLIFTIKTVEKFQKFVFRHFLKKYLFLTPHSKTEILMTFIFHKNVISVLFTVRQNPTMAFAFRHELRLDIFCTLQGFIYFSTRIL